MARVRATAGGGFASVQTPADTTPAAFTFTDVTAATVSTVYTSDAIVVSGLVGSSPISITGGTYNKNGGAYTSSGGTVINGDSITVRVTSSASALTLSDVVLTIGGVSDTYSVTTGLVNSEATALVARMSTQTSARQLLIDALWTAGKAHGWMTKLDLLYIFAANDSASALLNWRSTSFTPTLSDTHTFTADRGFQRTATAGYIDTNMAQNGGTQHVSNANGIYLYSRTSAQTGGANDADFGADAGSTYFGRVRSTADQIAARIQSTNASYSAASLDGSGYFAFARTGSGGTAVYCRRNNADVPLTGTAVATAFSSSNYRIGRNGANANSTATGREYAMFAIGANLTTGQSDSFYADLLVYLQAVGAA
jgi:hypothetical protein